MARRTKSSFKAALLSIGIGAVLFVIVTAARVNAFAKRSETRQADAAIVLGAGVYGSRPSPVLRERVNHAIWLYEENYTDVIILTGGQGDADEPSEADVARQYALAHGVPDDAILIEDTSTNTKENLANAQQLAAEHGLDTFLIVSTPFHMKRAMSIASDLGMAAYSSPTQTIEWISWFTKTRAYAQEVVSYMVYLCEKAA